MGSGSNGGWGAASHVHPASVPLVWLSRAGGRGGWKGQWVYTRKQLLPNFTPLLQSMKQHEALWVSSLGPVSSLKMKTKFSFKKGSLVEGHGPYFTSVWCQPKWQMRHNKRSHLASCFGTDNDAGVIPLVITAASK